MSAPASSSSATASRADPGNVDQVYRMLADGSLKTPTWPGATAWPTGNPLSEVPCPAALGSAPPSPWGGRSSSNGGRGGLAAAPQMGPGAGAVAAVLALGGSALGNMANSRKSPNSRSALALSSSAAEIQAQEQERRLQEEKRRPKKGAALGRGKSVPAEAPAARNSSSVWPPNGARPSGSAAKRQRNAKQQYQARQQRVGEEFPAPAIPTAARQNLSMPPPPPICRECGSSSRYGGDPGRSGRVSSRGRRRHRRRARQPGRRGRCDAATVVGVPSGAVAGHEIEKIPAHACPLRDRRALDDSSDPQLPGSAVARRQNDRVHFTTARFGRLLMVRGRPAPGIPGAAGRRAMLPSSRRPPCPGADHCPDACAGFAFAAEAPFRLCRRRTC